MASYVVRSLRCYSGLTDVTDSELFEFPDNFEGSLIHYIIPPAKAAGKDLFGVAFADDKHDTGKGEENAEQLFVVQDI